MSYDWELSETKKLQEQGYRCEAVRHISCAGMRWTIVIAILLMATIGISNVRYHFTALSGQLFSPENIQNQWNFTYQYRASLNAAAKRVCRAEKLIARAMSEREALHRRSQQIAHEQQYAEIETEYNVHMQKALQTGLVPPAKVLKKAPTLLNIKKQRCSPREAS